MHISPIQQGCSRCLIDALSFEASPPLAWSGKRKAAARHMPLLFYIITNTIIVFLSYYYIV